MKAFRTWAAALSLFCLFAIPSAALAENGIVVLRSTFVRPADTTAYTAQDLVAPSTSVQAANSPEVPNAVNANGDGVRIEVVRLRKSGKTLTNASFRVHFFNTQPTWTIADNADGGAITALNVSDLAGHVGYVDITMDRASATTGAYGVANPGPGAITVRPAVPGTPSPSLYYAIQATAGYTPTSGESFTLELEGIR